MQIECKLVVQNWDGMIAGLNVGKYDVIMDAIVVAPERSKVVAFTRAYAATPASFIAVKGRCYRRPRRSNFMMMRKRFRRAIAPLRAALKGKPSASLPVPSTPRLLINISRISLTSGNITTQRMRSSTCRLSASMRCLMILPLPTPPCRASGE